LEKQSFHANGKLLITGEYLVMQGALALAVPTRFGQKMQVSSGIREFENSSVPEGLLEWKSYYEGECWFEGSFSIPEIQVLESTDAEKADFIQGLLSEANKLNPELLKTRDSILVETRLDFSPDWGLGSSSSLISMIAQWFGIDHFSLFKRTQKGSGYDITCAKSDSPIWYRLVLGSPVQQKIVFRPDFRDRIAFIYSGKKQNSASAVASFIREKVEGAAKDRISEISREVISANGLGEFNSLVDEHERIMSGILKLPKIKDQRFADFPGSIKSLGAWGGDFIMASSDIGLNEILSYFSRKGLHTAFSFDEII
jgi:mevalonate kinase